MERDHVLGSEAGIDGDQTRGALQQQAGREQQHHRGADFDADQHLAQSNRFARGALRAQSGRDRAVCAARRDDDPAEGDPVMTVNAIRNRIGAAPSVARSSCSIGISRPSVSSRRSPTTTPMRRDRRDRRQHQVFDQQLSRQARLRSRPARCAPRAPIGGRRCGRPGGWRCWCRRAGRWRSRPGRAP